MVRGQPQNLRNKTHYGAHCVPNFRGSQIQHLTRGELTMVQPVWMPLDPRRPDQPKKPYPASVINSSISFTSHSGFRATRAREVRKESTQVYHFPPTPQAAKAAPEAK